MIIIKRVYDKYDSNYIKILVDRLWPRGISKENLNIDLWAKDLAPTNELRKQFNHEEQKFNYFKEKYISELNNNQYAKEFKNNYSDKNIVLLYSAKSDKFNNAIVLKEWLES
jgi:uncharacterized protein YeaO (DUF488 family)